MTEKEQASLKALFDRHGIRDKKSVDIRLTAYFSRPDQLDTPSSITTCDRSAAYLISDCQTLLEQLQAYRVALMERYQYISTAPAVRVIKLRREKCCGYRYGQEEGKVYYYLELFERRVDDGKEIELKIDDLPKTYPGTERRQAIKDFEAYIKAHPGIEAVKKIEKAKWEH